MTKTLKQIFFPSTKIRKNHNPHCKFHGRSRNVLISEKFSQYDDTFSPSLCHSHYNKFINNSQFSALFARKIVAVMISLQVWRGLSQFLLCCIRSREKVKRIITIGTTTKSIILYIFIKTEILQKQVSLFLAYSFKNHMISLLRQFFSQTMHWTVNC
jgi:hypothetical protein